MNNMEKTTIITSESELSTVEIQAIKDLIEKENFSIDLNKVVYLAGKEGFKKVALDTINVSPVSEPTIKEKEKKKKWHRRNIGINQNLRDLFDAKKKRNIKEIY